MIEKLVPLIFSSIVIVLFSMNFSSKWTNRNYEKLKDKDRVWFWLRIFNVEESKENYVRFIKGLSMFVIVIMGVTLIITLMSG